VVGVVVEAVGTVVGGLVGVVVVAASVVLVVVEPGVVLLVDEEEVLDVGVDATGAVDCNGCRLSESGVAVKSGCTGVPSSAAFIMSANIVAGYDPPLTATPCTWVIGVLPAGSPTQTAVANCGTKPTNQASV